MVIDELNEKPVVRELNPYYKNQLGGHTTLLRIDTYFIYGYSHEEDFIKTQIVPNEPVWL